MVLCVRSLLEMLVGLELAGMDDMRIVMHLTWTTAKLAVIKALPSLGTADSAAMRSNVLH